jgi:hypothetical protein
VVNQELDSIFGADSLVKEDEEREPNSSTTRITSSFASSDKAAVPVQQVMVMPGPTKRGAMDELMDLSTLTIIVLKEKLQRAGLSVSGRNKNELIKRLLKNLSS